MMNSANVVSVSRVYGSSHAFRPVDAVPVVGFAVAAWVLLLYALALIAASRTLFRLGCWLCRVFLRVFGVGFSMALSPFWVAFAILWPARLGGDVCQLPPLSCEFDGRTLKGGAFEVNSQFAVGVRRLPVAAHLECARLRSRARWVRRLETVLGEAPGVVGFLVKGRWTPDLPSNLNTTAANFALAVVEGGARILGGGSVPKGDKPESGAETYLIVELSDGSREVIFPELVSFLSAYSFCRERNSTLFSALRTRGLEWGKSAGLSGPEVWFAVLSAIRVVWKPSEQELRLLEVVSGPDHPSSYEPST